MNLALGRGHDRCLPAVRFTARLPAPSPGSDGALRAGTRQHRDALQCDRRWGNRCADPLAGPVEAYLGRRGFARLNCAGCDETRLVAFSCRGRGHCPSCMGRRVRITLKKAYRDGTVAVDMDRLSLLCRPATSVPPPRFHALRYAGALASASPWRPHIAPAFPPEKSRRCPASCPGSDASLVRSPLLVPPLPPASARFVSKRRVRLKSVPIEIAIE
jgi:hypothetical protein